MLFLSLFIVVVVLPREHALCLARQSLSSLRQQPLKAIERVLRVRTEARRASERAASRAMGFYEDS